MSQPMVVIDPGHGMGNRQLGVFDPGIVNAMGAQEAEWALIYARELAAAFAARGCLTQLTRSDNVQQCSLGARVAAARRLQAGLLVSVHFNGDAVPGDSPKDGKLKGFEALYRTPSSQRFAALAAEAASNLVQVRPTKFRPDLAVLAYDPSILLEIGFLDDPDDFALIQIEAFRKQLCAELAFTLAEALKR